MAQFLNIGKGILDLVKDLETFNNIIKKTKQSTLKTANVLDQIFNPLRRGRISKTRVQTTFVGPGGKKIKVPKVNKQGDPIFRFFKDIKLQSGQIVKRRISRKRGEAEFKAAGPDFDFGGSKIGKGFNKFVKKPLEGLGVISQKVFKPVDKIGTGMLKMFGIKNSKINNMKKAFGGFAKMGLKATGIGMIVGLIGNLLSAINPLQPVFEALTDIFGIYGQILSDSFTPLIEKLYDVMLSPTVIAMFESLTDVIMQVVIAILPLIDIFQPFAELIFAALLIPLQLLTPIITALLVPLGWLATLFQGFTAIIQGLFAGWETYLAPIFIGLSELFNKVAGVFTAIFKPVFDGIVLLFTNLSEGYEKYIKPAFEAIGDAFTMVWDSIKTIINSIIDGLNALDIANIIPDIPRLGTGGIVTQNTLAVVGDRPEAIIPLNDMDRFGVGSNNDTMTKNQADTMIEVLNGIRLEMGLRRNF